MNKLLKFFQTIEKLKTVQRQIQVSDGSHWESPAEHSWRMAVMAITLSEELKIEIDLLKTLKMILIHDIIEVKAGDQFTDALKGEDKEKAVKLQHEKEVKAADEIFGILESNFGKELRSLWDEFENGDSKEAKFARALDKFEVANQRMNLGYKNWHRHDIFEVVMNLENGHIDNFPEMKEIWEELDNQVKEQKNNAI